MRVIVPACRWSGLGPGDNLSAPSTPGPGLAESLAGVLAGTILTIGLRDRQPFTRSPCVAIF